MSRHRIVRRMNYEDEYYEDDEEYGHSYEDRYCVSPSTAAQFMYDRDQKFDLSSYMEEEIPEEGEGDMEVESKQAKAAAPKPGPKGLSDMDRGRLQSCLEEIHNVMGDSLEDSVLTEAILRHNFNIQAAINALLSQSDKPKEQRPQRKKRDHAQGDEANIEDLLSEINALDQQDHLCYKEVGGRFRFQKGMSPPAGMSTSSESSRGMSPSSVGSPSSILGGGLSLAKVMKASVNPIIGRGRADSVSDISSASSSPPQFASSPGTSSMTLIQKRKDSGSSILGSQIEVSSDPLTVLSSAQTDKGRRGVVPQPLGDLITSRLTSIPEPPKQTPACSIATGMSLSDIIRTQECASTASQEKTVCMSLSDLIRTQECASTASQEKSVSMSLSDLIRAQKSSVPESPFQTMINSSSDLQKSDQKLSPAPSLSELISQSKPPSGLSMLSSQASSISLSSNPLTGSSVSLSSSSSLSSLVSFSQVSKGLSLKELISVRSSHPKPDCSISKSEVSSSVMGPLLSDLIKSHSESKVQAASSGIGQPSNIGHSQSNMCASTTSAHTLVTGSSEWQMDRKGRGAVSGSSGLSLSDLIKQHQNKGSKQHLQSLVNSSALDINANTTLNSDSSQLADRMAQGLSLNPAKAVVSRTNTTQDSVVDSALKDTFVGKKEEVSLSLADCLKKKMTLQPKQLEPAVVRAEEEPVEEEDEPAAQEVDKFEADCFDPMKVDPAMKKCPSLFARCLSLQITKIHSFEKTSLQPARRKARFPKLTFSYQTRKRKMYIEAPLHKIVCFDFATPSPDDIVQARQKAAFGQGEQCPPLPQQEHA